MNEPIRFADALLTRVLAGARLDVEYVRAEGNTLYHRHDGQEVGVLDLVGGWGSLILGHNHPELVSEAKRLLDVRTPVHAQLSRHATADEVGAMLNRILRREFPEAEDYAIVFANSGAEAVEAAIKHAELDRVLRVKNLFEQIEWNASSAVAAVRAGEADAPTDVALLPGAGPDLTGPAGFAALLAAVGAHNLARLGTTPVFFALERSFHGKLVGSVQLTHNPDYRAAFGSLAVNARFVPPGQLDEFARLVDAERVTVLDLAIVDGKVTLVERDFPVFAGFLLEPIQGEGGIHELDRAYVHGVRRLCDQIDCPIIVDEVQSGMGRTGAFFASSHLGLLGDYYTLAKSLGGGLAKVSATLVRQSRYRYEFELTHSSTFAKDGFSTAIALKTLELLEAGEGEAYRRIAERGDTLLGMLRRVALRYPDVIADVRGRGLLVGVEFGTQRSADSPMIRNAASVNSLGFLVSSYLLLEHQVRTAPAASSPDVLRLEPSMLLTDEEIARIETAFTSLCEVLRGQDALHLLYPLIASDAPKPRIEVKDFRSSREKCAPRADEGLRKVGFVGYLLTQDMVRQLDPSLSDLNDDQVTALARRLELSREMGVLPPVRIDSPVGGAVELAVYPTFVTTRQMVEYLRFGQPWLIAADLDRRVRSAKADGCAVVGLGFAAATLTGYGAGLRVPGIAVTSGGALAIGSALRVLADAADERFGGLGGRTLAVVGGGGTLGCAAAALAADDVSRLVLTGSGGAASTDRLRAAVRRIYQHAWARIAEGGAELTGIPALLAEEPLIGKWVHEGRPAAEPSGAAIAEHLTQRYREDPFIAVGDAKALASAQAVLVAAWGPDPVLEPELLAPDAIVCDLSVPGVVPAGAAGDGRRYLRGGVLTAPGDGVLPPGVRAPLGHGTLFAGAAEAIVLALAEAEDHLAGNDLSGARVRELVELAGKHGFHPVCDQSDLTR